MQSVQSKLIALCTPMARFKALYSCNLAKTVTAKNACGLWHKSFIAKNVRIRLTENVWTEAGLYNGATGMVHDMIFSKETNPPGLPAVF